MSRNQNTSEIILTVSVTSSDWNVCTRCTTTCSSNLQGAGCCRLTRHLLLLVDFAEVAPEVSFSFSSSSLVPQQEQEQLVLVVASGTSSLLPLVWLELWNRWVCFEHLVWVEELLVWIEWLLVSVELAFVFS